MIGEKGMSIRIIRLEVCGIKGIKEKIAFDFENQTISKSIFDRPSIKAIYGTNGSGKTAVLTAVDIYRNVCTDGFYLYDSENSAALKKLINKQSKYFEIGVYFVAEGANAYVHKLAIDSNSDKPYIAFEEISRLTDRTINGNTEVMVRIEKSECVRYKEEKKGFEKKADSIIIDSISRLSEYRSVTSLFSDNLFISKINALVSSDIRNKNKPMNYRTTFMAISNARRLAEVIEVYLADSDQHKEITVGKIIEYVNTLKNQVGEPDKVYLEKNDYIVPVNKITDFEKHLVRVSGFIKLFKPSLNDIGVVKTLDGEKYRCRIVMNYADYSVDFEYESAGIKNLVSMFDCLETASNGGIGFIDEMDVNINEVYLEKLCSYFMKYGHGQLCITIHNTAPMKILKKKKHSLDFLNCSEQVVSWIRNGSKSPSSDYKDGMIPGLPFNVNDFDFIEVFGEN